MRGMFCALAALLAGLAAPASAKTILFVGNSFTYGALSPVQYYRPGLVTDLNRQGVGGVPALFKSFANASGLDWTVSLETASGMDLAWHLASKRTLIDRRWDAVVLQGYSIFDIQRPGDPARHVAAAQALAAMFRKANPQVAVRLVSTWSRADQVYRPGGRWFGQPIQKMAEDLAAGNRLALAAGSDLTGAIPVGAAWNRAMRDGVADPNPYDGIEFGKVSLWTWDQYHASSEGYYLEALTVFGSVTGVDPRTLAGKERASEELGIDPRVATRLRAAAAAELEFK